MVRRQDRLNVKEDGFRLAQGAMPGGTHVDENPVGDGKDEGVVGAGAPPLPRPLPREGGGEVSEAGVVGEDRGAVILGGASLL